MRRSPLLVVALVAAVLLLPLGTAACGGDDNGGDEANGTEEVGEDFRAALLTTGSLNNRSWANSWADGFRDAAADLGVQIEMVGNADTPDEYLSQGSAFASEGYDLIIFAFGAVREQALRVARQFPDTQIVTVHHPTEEELEEGPPNVGYVDPEQQQGTFLAGIVAGLLTETDTVGSVYAFPFPALTRQPEAYELGARCVNSDVETLQRQSNSFTDAAAARAAAAALIDANADLILSAVDQAVQGIIQAGAQARSQGERVFVFPSYFDSEELAPRVVITSVLYNLDGVAFDIIEKGMNREIGDRFFQSYTLENLGVGDLAPFYQQRDVVGEENIGRLEQVKEMIAGGTIAIPDETIGDPEVANGATIGEPGSAEQIDVADLGCTDEFREELGL